MSQNPSVFRLGEKIGSGAFGHVFIAHETMTGRIVALKKSRVSLKITRTILHHEARILQLLAGHPSIPPVFGYGRFEHFEYLAIERLGCTLYDIVEKEGRLSLHLVLNVALKMLSALEHIHSHRIVHRDVKPDNIMVQIPDTSAVYLIDFGISRPCVLGAPMTQDPIAMRRHVIGTLTWASLNAHQGIDLAPRDDLESLAYSLFFLLRGSLPWQKQCRCGTALGRIIQVREKKRAWPGTRLGEGYPPVFGQLLDYARALEFNAPIDYHRFRTQLDSLQQEQQNSNYDVTISADPLQPSRKQDSTALECPVQVGQLVCVQIVAHTSIEGYSMQVDDPSHWYDPELVSEEWKTSPRPAIVIDTAFDKRSSLHMIQVVSMGRGRPDNGESNVSACFLSSLSGKGDIMTDPPWTIPETYCYAFPRATWFYCLPGQECDPAYWRIDSHGLQLLKDKFNPKIGWSHWLDTRNDPDPDVRHDTRMHRSHTQFFVEAMPLTPWNVESICIGNPMDWRGNRAWFDERVRISKRRGGENGVDWTASGDTPVFEERGWVKMNSYFASDHSLWESPQRERDFSLTLNLDGSTCSQEGPGSVEVPNILRVE